MERIVLGDSTLKFNLNETGRTGNCHTIQVTSFLDYEEMASLVLFSLIAVQQINHIYFEVVFL